jgi:membrane protease YdiL (CAAX protease family)
MNDNPYLFAQKWKNILAIIIIVLLSFLDKVIPPAGIPIAVISIFILFRWKKVSIKYLGLYNPKNWLKTILIGLVIGVFIQVFGIYVLSPIKEWMGIVQEIPAAYAAIEGNNSKLIIYLVVAWTTAGFGEEIIYRSFFLGQFVSVFNKVKSKWILSLIISSIIFGFLHFNNGIDAIIGTTINGFIIGLVYLKTGRNIWAAYVTHAVANTVGFLIIYSGLYKDIL